MCPSPSKKDVQTVVEQDALEALGKDCFVVQANLLKALAHASRLMIVHRLASGECSAGELTTLVGSDQSTVSKHLALLRLHGIVSDRREGSTVFYTLQKPCIVNFLLCACEASRSR